ncbi:protein SDA1 homolog isoform X2 [Macadamia integrifolia]|nr:protein SDA1 homolog isoform X2 [Macadamia integrifolia]
MNRKVVDIGDNLALFMELQTLGDRAIRKLAFSHVVHSIRRMNQKHKNEANNRKLQNILFAMIQQEDESKAKRSLTVLCDLHRRRVWFDDRTANAICTACFHSSSRIMIAALSFLLGFEKIEADDGEGSSSEDDMTSEKPHVVISREDVYKAHNKGTSRSKKKKLAKLKRATRSMERQQRISQTKNSSYYSPLGHLKDAQGFAEKLFSRLQACNERFEVKMMMLKVIARTVGLHRLILLNFYPFLQKYVQPHQRDVTELLAAAIDACHDMVPPDAVELLFRQIVNQFVHDRSRTEAIAVGLNTVREICLRMPLLMTEDLLQDLVLYKKSHEKAVSSAARSLITLFREICPSLLVKKDRGRPTDPKAKPKAFGEVNVPSDVPGIELLSQHNGGSDNDDDEEDDDDDDDESKFSSFDDGEKCASDDELQQSFLGDSESEDDVNTKTGDENNEQEGTDSENEDDANTETEDEDNDQEGSDDNDDVDDDYEDETAGEMREQLISPDNVDNEDEERDKGEEQVEEKTKSQKRKYFDLDGQLNAADTSLRALKRLAGAKIGDISSDSTDVILSNEDFQKIKQLKAKEDAKIALMKHGLLRKGSDAKSATFKIPSSEQLSIKRVDPSKLEVNIRRKISKEEKLALVKAGREDRGKYQARTAVKQKKKGGLSNRQKEHKKAMPLAAKRAKVSRTREVKKKLQRSSGKQFRGRKAWK